MDNFLGCLKLIFTCGTIVFVALLVPIFLAIHLSGHYTLGESFLFSIVCAAMVTSIFIVAGSLLSWKDSLRHRRITRSVQQMLLLRDKESGLKESPVEVEVEHEILESTRIAVAEFFGVPESRVRVDDRLAELRFAELEPGFHTHVIYRVFEHKNIDVHDYFGDHFIIETAQLQTVRDLAGEVQKVIRELAGKPGHTASPNDA